MNNQYATLSFEASLSDIGYVNSSFDTAILQIAYHGDNHNGSSISKDDFEKAIPSMFNCPVVCRYFREENEIGGHDVEVVKDESSFKLVNLTQPVGVVPESAGWFWRDVEEDDGVVREYLCTDVLLWKRQEAYGYIKEHGIVGQSMEINIIHGYKRSDGFKVYDKFEFTAFCLLGEGVTPCFESASLEIFERDDMQTQMAEMMSDFKREFSMVNTASADDTYSEILPKGGNREMNLNELMAKYSLSAEDVNFDTDGMSERDIEARFAEIQAAKENPSADHVGPSEPAEEPAGEQTFSLTANQVFESLWEALQGETYVDEFWGEACILPRYCLMDFDLESHEVYVWDYQESRMYGFSFTMNGDRAEIDFNSKKRKKTVYMDYDEGDASFACENPFSKMKETLYEAYSNLEGEAAELRTFKDNTIKAEAASKRKDALDAVFAKFECLNGNEMFETLRSSCDEMTIEEIEDKCYSIKGRIGSDAQFSLNPENNPAIRIPSDAYPVEMFSKKDKRNDEPYGGIFAEFGIGQRD